MKDPELLDRIFDLLRHLLSIQFYGAALLTVLAAATLWSWFSRRNRFRNKPFKRDREDAERSDSIRSESLPWGVLLPDIARGLTLPVKPKQVIECLIEQVRIIFPFATHIAYFQLERENPNEARLFLRAAYGLSLGDVTPIPLGRGMIGVAAQETMLLWRKEVENRFGRHVIQDDERQGYYTPDVVVPLVLREQFFGALTLRGGLEQVDREQAHALDFLAGLGAIALSHALKVLALDEANSLLKERSEQLSKFNTDLQSLVSEKVAQLRAAESRLMLAEQLAIFGEFVASLAHDIKTPLAFISGEAQWAGELLRDEQIDREGLTKSLDIIRKNSARLKDDLQGLLQKLRTPDIEHEEARLDSIMQEVVDLALSAAKHKGVRVLYEPRGKDFRFRGYPTLLRHALTNLVSNALDATNSGGTITIRLRDRDKLLEVQVEDTGCGISEEDLPRIFDLFFSRKESGTGLGLSSVKRIVEKQHGGSITVTSEIGKGTSFVVGLPRTVAKGGA